MKLLPAFLSILFILLVTNAFGQSKTRTFDLYKLNQKGKLEIINRTIIPVIDKDRKGIRFSEIGEDGVAWLEGIEFENGIIEFDVRGKDQFQRSFVGVAFHGVNEKTLDAVYFRPFNFQATDSVRQIHAVQYVSHPEFTWKKLRAEKNGKYEKAINTPINPNDWFHVKVVVEAPFITVYVNNNLKPCLAVQQLAARRKGKIGFWVGFDSGGDFANLKIITN